MWWGIQIEGLGRGSPEILPSIHGGEESSLPALVPPDVTVNSESVVSIQPGDSGVVIGYRSDEFTHTWSAEHFVAHSHIYPGFMGKVSSFSYSALENQGVRIIPFKTKQQQPLNRA